MEAANEEELKELDEMLAEAEKIEGESKISDALKARANYLTRIGDKVCFLFLHHFPRLHEMNLRTILTSPKSSHSQRHSGSDHASTSHWPSSALGSSSPTPRSWRPTWTRQRSASSPHPYCISGQFTSSQTNRRRRQLGPPQPPQSLHRPALPLYPPIQARWRATSRCS